MDQVQFSSEGKALEPLLLPELAGRCGNKIGVRLGVVGVGGLEIAQTLPEFRVSISQSPPIFLDSAQLQENGFVLPQSPLIRQ